MYFPRTTRVVGTLMLVLALLVSLRAQDVDDLKTRIEEAKRKLEKSVAAYCKGVCISATVRITSWVETEGGFEKNEQGAGVCIDDFLMIEQKDGQDIFKGSGVFVLTDGHLVRWVGGRPPILTIETFHGFENDAGKPRETYKGKFELMRISENNDPAKLALIKVPFGARDPVCLPPAPTSKIPQNAPNTVISAGVMHGGEFLFTELQQIQTIRFKVTPRDAETTLWTAQGDRKPKDPRDMWGGPMVGLIGKGIHTEMVLLGIGTPNTVLHGRFAFVHAEHIAEFIRPHLKNLPGVESAWKRAEKR